MIYTARATYKGISYAASCAHDSLEVLFSVNFGPSYFSKWITTGPRSPRIARSPALLRAIPKRALSRLEAQLRRQGAALHLMPQPHSSCREMVKVWRETHSGISRAWQRSLRLYQTEMLRALRENGDENGPFVLVTGTLEDTPDLGPGEIVRIEPSETVVSMPERVLVVGDPQPRVTRRLIESLHRQQEQLEQNVFDSLYRGSPADVDLRNERLSPLPWSEPTSTPLQDINKLADEIRENVDYPDPVFTIPIPAFVNLACAQAREIAEYESASALSENWRGIRDGSNGAFDRLVEAVGYDAAHAARAYLRYLFPEQGEPLNEPLAPPATFQEQRAAIIDEGFVEHLAEPVPELIGEYDDPLYGIDFLKGLQTRLDE